MKCWPRSTLHCLNRNLIKSAVNLMPGFWLSTAWNLQSRSVKCQFCRNSYRTQHLYSASPAWCDDGLWFTQREKSDISSHVKTFSCYIQVWFIMSHWIKHETLVIFAHFHILREKWTPLTEGDTALAAGLSDPTHHLLAMSECFGVVWLFETNQRTHWILNKKENQDDWRVNYLVLAEMFSFPWLFV